MRFSIVGTRSLKMLKISKRIKYKTKELVLNRNLSKSSWNRLMRNSKSDSRIKTVKEQIQEELMREMGIVQINRSRLELMQRWFSKAVGNLR